MSITPIGSINEISGLFPAKKAEKDGQPALFGEILKNAVNSANETDRLAKEEALSVASGKSDDLHTLMIDISKADLALYTLVQVRNKALDAYNEIMRISL